MNFHLDGIKMDLTQFANDNPKFIMAVAIILLLFPIIKRIRNKREDNNIKKIRECTQRIEWHTLEILNHLKSNNEE